MELQRYVKPALIGGVVTGMLSSIPFVNMGNCACCMYLWAGSVLAAYLLFREYAGGSLGDGALVGLFSGIVGAVVATILSLPLTFLMPQFDPTQFIPPEQLEQLPPFLVEMMSGGSPEFLLAAILAGFFINLALYGLIGTLGGLIGAAIFRQKEQEQTAPPPQTWG